MHRPFAVSQEYETPTSTTSIACHYNQNYRAFRDNNDFLLLYPTEGNHGGVFYKFLNTHFGPLKLDFIETRLEAPQQSLDLDTGVKFTRNKKIEMKWNLPPRITIFLKYNQKSSKSKEITVT